MLKLMSGSGSIFLCASTCATSLRKRRSLQISIASSIMSAEQTPMKEIGPSTAQAQITGKALNSCLDKGRISQLTEIAQRVLQTSGAD